MGAAAAVAGIGAAAGIGGALIQGGASKSAGNQAAAAQLYAAQLQQQQFDATRQTLAPFVQAGQAILPDYSNFYKTSADQLGQAFSNAENAIPQPMTEANLINTPGYQFNLSQGLRAVANSNAAKGLGVSGSALQGAARYATGLADTTYQNQFANEQQIYQDYLSQLNAKQNQLSTIFGQIQAPVTTGANAAAMTGQLGQQAATGAGNAIAQAGAAQAAGTVGAGNAAASGLSSVGNAGLTYLGIQNALNGGSLSGGNNSGYVDSGTF